MAACRKYEFNIPFSDVRLGTSVKSSEDKRQEILWGNWHGEVLVHYYRRLSPHERERFWEEAQRLSRIRHENVVLFMGVSFDPPNAAFITRCARRSTRLGSPQPPPVQSYPAAHCTLYSIAPYS